MHMWSALFLLSLNCIPAYILHTYTFPNIPYTAGVYHIHSPVHFMETHGFALPGFRITETCSPQRMGGYVVTEFNFTTHFGGHMSAKVFSGGLDTSHVLVRDCGGEPCMLGRLKVQKLSVSGHVIQARGDLLRPAKVWEQLLGGQTMVSREGVEKAVKMGYCDFKNKAAMVLYVNMVMDAARDGGI